MSISDHIAVIDHGVLQQYDKPQAMYQNPCNVFVANFLGMPQINMLEADITDAGVLHAGALLRARADFPDGIRLPNGHYRIGIRPEDFELSQNGLPQVADHVRMTGPRPACLFHLGRYGAAAAGPIPDQPIVKGSAFGLRVRPGHLIVFGSDDKVLAKC